MCLTPHCVPGEGVRIMRPVACATVTGAPTPGAAVPCRAMEDAPTRALAVLCREIRKLFSGRLSVREAQTRAFGDVARGDPRWRRLQPRRRRQSVSPVQSVRSGRGGGEGLPRLLPGQRERALDG